MFANNRRQGWLGLAALLVVTIWSIPTARAQAARTGLVATKSRLPYPPRADIWVDAQGSVSVTVPGPEPGTIDKVAAIVFRPQGDNLTWDVLTTLFVERELLLAAPKPEFSVTELPKGDITLPGTVANLEETNVYKSRTEGEWIVLGFIRDLHTQHQLAYGVQLSGKLTHVQALAQAKSMVNELGGRAQAQNPSLKITPVITPPAPPGAAPSDATRTLRGPQLGQLLQSIVGTSFLSDRVKNMARHIIPQATSVTLYRWRTQAPMADQAFFDFYTRTARSQGWGAPISKDETQASRPTMLFQRPTDSAVMMVRAQPTPIGGVAGLRPTTTISVLVMEGKINTSGLGN